MYELEFSGEEEINEKLNQFTRSMKKCYGGVNTVQAQLGFPSDRGQRSTFRKINYYEDFFKLKMCQRERSILADRP